MPEIAEVEVIRRKLEPLTGAQVTKLTSQEPDLAQLDKVVAGREVVGTDRHGKRLGLMLRGDTTLAVHLRMTGALLLGDETPPHLRATVHLQAPDGQNLKLHFDDPRRFGTMNAIAHSALGDGQGPDLFEEFDELLGSWSQHARRRRAVKAALLDQGLIAGIGNYLADEGLHSAQTSPMTVVADLGEHLWRQVLTACRDVACEALDHGGVSMRDYRHPDGSRGHMQDRLKVYGKSGQPCPRCGHTLAKTTVAGRGTTYCPACQL